jgi:hypothetical protein
MAKIILSTVYIMLKSALRGVTRFFTTERVILLVVFLILAYGLYVYSGSKTVKMDGMDTGSAVPVAEKAAAPIAQVPAVASGYTAQAVASPQDLLPQDQNSQWAALNPVAQGNIAAPDLLQAGYHIGLDTIGQTLRNANLQERSDPIIPKANVGPWMQSTIEPDLGRVPLEVGAGLR